MPCTKAETMSGDDADLYNVQSATLCLTLKTPVITCRVDCGSRVHHIAARGWPWLFPSGLLLPQACGHPGQGLYKGEEQGQGVGGETIRERAIQGTGQNPEAAESWGSGCRSNPGPRKKPGACRSHCWYCSWTPRPLSFGGASCPARPTTQLGGAGKRVRDTGFPTTVICPWCTKNMLQERRPRPLFMRPHKFT